MSYSDFLKAIKEFKQNYNNQIEESKVNGEYNTCDWESIRKYVFKPYSELSRIFMEHPDTQISMNIPNTMAMSVNITLPQLFEFLKSMSKDQILHYVNKMQIDMLFREDILESIENEDYDLFCSTAKSSRKDFESFAGTFKTLYFVESAKQSESELDDIDDEDDYYQITKHEFIKDIYTICITNYLKDGEFAFVSDYVEKAINQATSTFPTQESLGDGVSFDKWIYEEYSYCFYLKFIVDNMFIDMDPFFNRILWHPSTIKLRLKWSAIYANSPSKYRTVTDDFFDMPENTEEDHLKSIRPEFEMAGVVALERLLDLCPFKNGNDGYRTFVYRITGRSRPDVEVLPTDLFFTDSAPYIYYFINGIADPDKSEDVYGKMKSYFTTTEFPDDENDIPEPCDSWKEALAELYPTIFGNSESQSYLSLDRPDCMFQKELNDIGEIFFPGQNFHLLFSTPPSLTEPLKWEKSWDELNYLLRVIYTGQVIGDNIDNTGGKIKQWDEIHKCFVKNGEFPSKLQNTGWNKLRSILKNRHIEIDNKLRPILERVKRIKKD